MSSSAMSSFTHTLLMALCRFSLRLLFALLQEDAVAIRSLIANEVPVIEHRKLLCRVETDRCHPRVQVRLVEPHPTVWRIFPIFVDYHYTSVGVEIRGGRIQISLPVLNHVQHSMEVGHVDVLHWQLWIVVFAKHGAEVRHALFLGAPCNVVEHLPIDTDGIQNPIRGNRFCQRD